MIWNSEGMTQAEREKRGAELMRMDEVRRHFERHSLQLAADNTAPVRRQRQPIRGIRIINGDDGGPDAA